MTERSHYEVFYGEVMAQAPQTDWTKAIEAQHAKDPSKEWMLLPEMLDQPIPDGTPVIQQAASMTLVMQELVEAWIKRQADPYSFGTLTSDLNLGALFVFLEKGLGWPQGDVLTSILMLYHLLSHKRAGRHVYEVSPGLGEQLQHTELRGLLSDDLRLPYENVLIQVPSRCGFKVWNDKTGWHRLKDIYITQDSKVRADTNEDTGVSIGGGRGWRFLLCGESKNGQAGDDALSHFWIPLDEGQKLDDLLDRLEVGMRREKEEAHESDLAGFGLMMDHWRAIFTWAMNVMLYATWSDPGERIMANADAKHLWNRLQKLPPKAPRRRELLDRFQKLDPMRRILLGKSVYVVRGAERNESSIPESAGRSPQAWIRYRVAGHWRHQPHGPGHSLRRLQWISPFWKGDEDAPVSSPKHEVA